MRKTLVIIAGIVLAGCSISDGSSSDGRLSCSNGDQKRFVRDVMQSWYLWNDLLPNKIPVSDYATPEELLAALTTYSPDDGTGNPIDAFSFIDSAAADAQFFLAGQFEGFGFSFKTVASGDIRITQVYENSPAELGGLARGQRFLQVNGRTLADIEAAEGFRAVLDSTPLTFLMSDPGGAQFETTLAHDLVTIIPIPQYRIIPAGDGSGRMVGYLELRTFISPADPVFDTVFADFNANGVNDVIIDLRYNSGGLVRTADLLGDYLGGDVAENALFTDTKFNADRAADNDRQSFFDRLANSVSLSRLVVIATGSTASASEMVTNGMEPHVDVTIVGSSTFGKPVGQVGFEFCEKIIRATAFKLANADGFGEYFDGLPADCAAVDDLDVPVGADADPNMVAAMSYLDTGACPVAAPVTATQERGDRARIRRDARGPAWREFAGAY